MPPNRRRGKPRGLYATAMRKIWALLLAFWAFIADTAQILGVDWRQVFTFGLTIGGGTAVIGFITDVGPFPLAIGAAAAGFFAAGALALSQYRKAAKLRPIIQRPKPAAAFARYPEPQPKPSPKPRYAPPPDAKQIDITTATYKELGALMESVGRDIQRFENSTPYNASYEKVISEFHKEMSPHILWVYGEAKRRGHVDDSIDNFYRNPNDLETEQIKWLAKSLVKMGAQLTLYFDS